MKISQARLQQIIKKEVIIALKESKGSLSINDINWEVEYNDPEMGSQQGNINVGFSWMGEPGEVVVSIVSFTETAKYIVERITEEINYSINLMKNTENSEQFVAESQVKHEMGEGLDQLMQQLAEEEDLYNKQASYL